MLPLCGDVISHFTDYLQEGSRLDMSTIGDHLRGEFYSSSFNYLLCVVVGGGHGLVVRVLD